VEGNLLFGVEQLARNTSDFAVATRKIELNFGDEISCQA
jgi:hypothetical protein